MIKIFSNEPDLPVLSQSIWGPSVIHAQTHATTLTTIVISARFWIIVISCYLVFKSLFTRAT